MSSKKKNFSQSGKLKKVNNNKKSTRDLGQSDPQIAASLPETPIPPSDEEELLSKTDEQTSPKEKKSNPPISEADDNETTVSFQAPELPEKKSNPPISESDDNEATVSFQAPELPEKKSNPPISESDDNEATVSFQVPELPEKKSNPPISEVDNNEATVSFHAPELPEKKSNPPVSEVDNDEATVSFQVPELPEKKSNPPVSEAEDNEVTVSFQAPELPESVQDKQHSNAEIAEPADVEASAEEEPASPPTDQLPDLTAIAPLPLFDSLKLAAEANTPEMVFPDTEQTDEAEASTPTDQLPALPPMLNQENNQETQNINFSTGTDVKETDTSISETTSREATFFTPQNPSATPASYANLQDYATIPETPLPDLTNLPTSTLPNASAEPSFETREITVAAPPQTPALAEQPARSIEELVASGADMSLTIPPRDTPNYERWRRHRKIVMRHLARKHLQADRRGVRKRLETAMNVIGSILLIIIILSVTVAGTGGLVAYKFYSDTQAQFNNSVVNLRALMPRDNLKMYDKNGEIIGQITSDGVHTFIPYNQISSNVVNATVSTEDKNFWKNEGYDLNRIIQQVINNATTGYNTGGASTVTQQLIKLLVVGGEESYIRKLQEISLTPLINDMYTKQDIMEMYLNTAFFGHQAYGIEAAATIYYDLHPKDGKSAASQLDIAQSAVFAGLLTNPSGLDPHVNPEGALHRTETVLSLMLDNGYITQAEHDAAVTEAYQDDFFKTTSFPNRAPHFFDYVLRQLMDRFHLNRDQLARSDMTVNTTLDLGLQDKVLQIAKDQINSIQDLHNVHNSAEVMLDTKTSAIRVLLGSVDYDNADPRIQGQYDMASVGMRPPGSSIKPYIFLAAFEKGASPGQSIADVPTNFPNPGGVPDPYNPQNYTLKNYGHMTLRCALQNSLNVPAVKVLREVGYDNADKMVRRLGINRIQTQDDAGWGMTSVLGTLDINLLEHTAGYASMANGGKHIAPYAIEKVTFSNSKQEYTRTEDPGTQAVSPQLAYMITNVLSDNTDRIPDFGTCNALELYSNSESDCFSGNKGQVRPAAAKTGTTQDFKDNWTMGYTTDYVMGVWAGNSDNEEMLNEATGLTGAAPIWHNSMLVAEEGKPIQDFNNPGGLVTSTMTNPDGVRSTDLFLADHVNQYLAKSQTDTVKGSFSAPKGTFCPSYQLTRGAPGDNKGAW